jgi:hypothetical protein
MYQPTHLMYHPRHLIYQRIMGGLGGVRLANGGGRANNPITNFWLKTPIHAWGVYMPVDRCRPHTTYCTFRVDTPQPTPLYIYTLREQTHNTMKGANHGTTWRCALQAMTDIKAKNPRALCDFQEKVDGSHIVTLSTRCGTGWKQITGHTPPPGNTRFERPMALIDMLSNTADRVASRFGLCVRPHSNLPTCWSNQP